MKLCKTNAERIAASGVWKRRFALFPTFLDDGCAIWLERYEAMDEYCTLHNVAFWRKHRRRVLSAGTSSGGPGGPTTSQRISTHAGGLG